MPQSTAQVSLRGEGLVVQYTAMLLGAAALSYLLGFPVRRIALYFDIVDHPERRKMHGIPVPLMGGLAIFLSFGIVTFVSQLVFGGLDSASSRSYLGLMAGGALILALGVYDDVRGLKASSKFLGQAVAALVVVLLGARIDLFTNPLGESIEIGWLGVPLTLLWIIGVTNAVNLIDGLDGLAVGVASIAALGLFAVTLQGQPFLAGLCIALAGAGIGFLRHNFYPARIFLGDSGSMFVGFALAVIGLHGSVKATTATVLFLPIIVLGVPIFDTLFAILRRARRRVNPFKADREHIHHRLVRIGLHHRNVVLVLYFICAYLALTAYSIARFPYQTAFLFLVLLTMGGIIGLRTLRFIEERLEVGLMTPQAVSGRSSSATPPEGIGPHQAGNGKGGAGRRPSVACTTLLCEVAGLRDRFFDRAEIDRLCHEIRSMLSRRVRVDTVIAEPSAPGHMVLFVRTEKLEPALMAQIKDGLAWHMEQQQGSAALDDAPPTLRWIRMGHAPVEESGATMRPKPAGGRRGGGKVSAEGSPSRSRKGPLGALTSG